MSTNIIRKKQCKSLENKSNTGFRVAGFIILAVQSIALIYPLLWILMSSFKGIFEFSENIFGLPQKWEIANYTTAFTNLWVPVKNTRVYIEQMFLNSIVYALLYTILPTLANCFVAYACAKYHGVFGKIIHATVVLMLTVPIIGGLSSGLQMAMWLGTYDNMLFSVLLQLQPQGTSFLIFYATFKGISWEFAEAGIVDGASHFKILTSIMIPLARNTLFALMLVKFIALWNDWQTALIWFPSYPTISYGLYRFSNTNAGTGNTMAGIPVQFSACVMAAAPMIVLFIIFKKKLIGNLSMGGLKG